MDERAQKLLDAHVAHELARLRGESLAELIDARVLEVFAWLEELRFADAVRLEDVVGLAERYALELRVSGGISELAGEIARVVLTSDANTKATVGEIVSSESFEEFSDKIAGLDGVRAQMISLIAQSEALGVVTARIVAHVLTDLLRRAGQRAARGPLTGLMGRLEQSVLPALERRAGALVGRQLEQGRALFAAEVEHHLRDILDGAALAEIAEELWLHIARKRVAEAFALIGEQDLEDFVVLCFEFWLRFRKSPYMRQVLGEAIGLFFDKYAEESVAGVIADMGVSSGMVANELKLLIIPLAEQAAASGFLEAQLRQHLADFYASDAFSSALD